MILQAQSSLLKMCVSEGPKSSKSRSGRDYFNVHAYSGSHLIDLEKHTASDAGL